MHHYVYHISSNPQNSMEGVLSSFYFVDEETEL